MTLDIARFASPLGTMIVASREGRLCALEFEARWPRRQRALEKRFGPLQLRTTEDPVGVLNALRDYFAGKLEALDAIAVDPGGTPFQQRVWSALRRIAPGTTVSYAALARRIDAPAAVRAVGAANGANPICLAIPCHRVIGADGSLTGYAGGVHRKRWLLAHEGRTAA